MAQVETSSHTSCERTPQMMQIQAMIKVCDPEFKISQQINQCMIDDGLTLEILSFFDEKSLSETIDSWKINTFGKRMSIIRGLLVSGIRHTKIMNNCNQQSIVSQAEIRMMEQLVNYENAIIHKINKFENESKLNQENQQNELKMDKKRIESVFDNLISILIQRKQVLLDKLDKISIQCANEEANYISKLKLNQKNILKLKQDYHKNMQIYNQMNDISKRTQLNTDMIKTFLNKNNWTKYDFNHSNCKVSFDNNSLQHLIKAVTSVGNVTIVHQNSNALAVCKELNFRKYEPGESATTGWELKNISNHDVNVCGKLIKVSGDGKNGGLSVTFDTPVEINVKQNQSVFLCIQCKIPVIAGTYEQIYELRDYYDLNCILCSKLKITFQVNRVFSLKKEYMIGQLYNMGFKDRNQIVDTLNKHKWNLEDAVNQLVQE